MRGGEGTNSKGEELHIGAAVSESFLQRCDTVSRST
jgi:hypothetical protein